VVAAHWHAPKAVVYINSLVWPRDYVLSEWGGWLRAVETL
jgi:hypothetical protein